MKGEEATQWEEEKIGEVLRRPQGRREEIWDRGGMGSLGMGDKEERKGEAIEQGWNETGDETLEEEDGGSINIKGVRVKVSDVTQGMAG